MVHGRGRGLGHHARSHRVILLLGLLLGLLGLLPVRILLHHVTPTACILLLLGLLSLGRGSIRGHIVSRDGRVGSRRRPRCVRVTAVRVLHGLVRRMAGLQGR
jgi:hypothetical protein